MPSVTFRSPSTDDSAHLLHMSSDAGVHIRRNSAHIEPEVLCLRFWGFNLRNLDNRFATR